MTTNIKAGPAINTGPYSFERDARPVWRDTNTGELCGFPDFADTQSTVMDAAELKADQMRAPAAPRIPRVHRLVGVDMAACTGDCAQGRRPCSGHGECTVSRLEPMDDTGRSLICLLCLSILLVMVPALVIGVSWSDVIDLLAAIGAVR